MVLKVGPIRSAREALSVREADIIGLRVPEDEHPGTEVDVGSIVTAIRATSNAAVSLQVNPIALDRGLISRLAPDYLEFVPADPEKPDLLAQQLESIASLGLPLICTGFVLAADDLSLFDRESHLEQLVAAGARYLQIELESVVDAEFRISSVGRQRLGDLLSRFPVLITDAFTDLDSQTGVGETGVYLELGIGRSRPQRFALSAALRLMRPR